MNVKDNQSGSVIIIALTLLLTLALIVGVLSFVILNAIRSSNNYSFAMRSYYAADAGSEQALYYLHAARGAKNVGLEQTADTLSALSGTLDNEAIYQVSAVVSSQDVVLPLKENDSIQLDLFSEDYSSSYTLVALDEVDPVNINIQWIEDTTCSPGNSAIEISFSAWSPLLWEDYGTVTDFQNKYMIQCPGPSGSYTCGYMATLDPGMLYKMRIKALQCSLSELSVTAQDSSGSSIALNNYLEIESHGQLSGTEQVIRSTSLWHSPLINYFDYVLFSEDQITK